MRDKSYLSDTVVGVVVGYHHFKSIIVAGSNPLERLGVSTILRQVFAWDTLQIAVDYVQLKEMMNDSTSLVLLDLELPGLTSHGHVRNFRLAFPRMKLVALSPVCGAETLLSVLGSGVHGIVPKSLCQEDFAGALRAIAKGQLYVPCELSDRAALAGHQEDRNRTVPTKDLSARQREVLSLAVQGFSNKEIGRRLQIAEATVKVHASAAFRVMGVCNRAGAIAAMGGYQNIQRRLQLSS